MKKKVLVAGLLLMALLLMSAGLWFWHATTSHVVLSSEVVVTIPVGAGAGEAARLGLVDRLVEPGASLVAAVELAREIAASAGAGAMKRVFVDAQPDLFE